MQPDAATAPIIVRMTTPADIIGMLPHRLGFNPQESLVLLCLEGPRRRDRLVMRVDLVAAAHDEQVAADLAARAAHVHATAAVVVCYTDAADAPDGSRPLARAVLVDTLASRLEHAGIVIVEALLVRKGRWWSYRCDDPRCCPDTGTTISDVLTTAAGQFAAETVASGSAVLDDRESLVAGIEPPGHAVATAVRSQACTEAMDLLVAAMRADGPAAARELTLSTLGRLAQDWSGGRCDVTPVDAAVVALGLRVKETRDEAMTFVLDHEPGLLVALLSELARRTDDRDGAPVCTVLAWAAYADGGGALASVAAERAIRCEPGNAMAELVLDGLSRMVSPTDIRDISAQVRADLLDAAG